jgi:hypothetical protein
MKRKSQKLRLSRETLGALEGLQLAGVVGATSNSTCAENSCPSACIGMCNPSDTCLSQCHLCPTQPPPSRRNC